MKKGMKIVLIIVCIFVLCIVLDILSIYTRNKPIFAIKDNNAEDIVYKGLIYDTYNCREYSAPQIKAKWSKFICSNKLIPLEVKSDFKIIDKTEICAQALEKFYEDEQYEYYFHCIKNATTLLNFGKYFDGSDVIFTVKDALEKNMVTIKQLEEKGLDFIRKSK